MANPLSVSWTDPTQNTDGSAITAGEITGYGVGVRLASGTAGTYTSTAAVSPTSTLCLLSALAPPLVAGSYVAAVRVVGPTNSAWSAESTAFTIAAGVPNPPTAVLVA